MSSWVVAWISWLFLHLCFPYIVLTFKFCPFTQQLPQLLLFRWSYIREDVECWGELCFAHVSPFAMLSSLLSQMLAGNLAVQTIGSRRDPKITGFFLTPELNTWTNCYIRKKKVSVSGDGDFVLCLWQIVALKKTASPPPHYIQRQQAFIALWIQKMRKTVQRSCTATMHTHN